MWAPRYFPTSYWAGRYWPPGGAAVPVHPHAVVTVTTQRPFHMEWANLPDLTEVRTERPPKVASRPSGARVRSRPSTQTTQDRMALVTGTARSTVTTTARDTGATTSSQSGGGAVTDHGPASDVEVRDD